MTGEIHLLESHDVPGEFLEPGQTDTLTILMFTFLVLVATPVGTVYRVLQAFHERPNWIASQKIRHW
jgi:hypothetical protein